MTDSPSSNKRVSDEVLASFIDEYREGCELHLLLSELRDRRAPPEPGAINPSKGAAVPPTDALRTARLEWAMACECPCSACETLHNRLQAMCGDAPTKSAEAITGAITSRPDVRDNEHTRDVRDNEHAVETSVVRTVWTKSSDSDPYCVHCGRTWDMHLCDGFSSCPQVKR